MRIPRKVYVAIAYVCAVKCNDTTFSRYRSYIIGKVSNCLAKNFDILIEHNFVIFLQKHYLESNYNIRSLGVWRLSIAILTT